MHTLSPTLRTYIEAHIIPLYDTFDPAHQRNHVLSVIDRSMALAAHYDVNPDMVYAIAAYHDTGLSRDRQTHHPELNEQAQIARATHHLIEKYGDNGYLKLWIPESPNRQRLQEVRSLLNTPAQLRQTLQQIYTELTAASSATEPSTCKTSN